MKYFIHVIHQDSDKFYVKIPGCGVDELVRLNVSKIPEEIRKEHSDLVLDNINEDYVVRLYANIRPSVSISLLEFSDWEVRKLPQDHIDEVVFHLMKAMIKSTATFTMSIIRQILPDVPDSMIGISVSKYDK